MHQADILINPLHPDAAKLRISYNEPFDFDPRFFGWPNPGAEGIKRSASGSRIVEHQRERN